MVDLTEAQRMIVGTQYAWSHAFGTFVFVAGRRSGKRVMATEMILDEIRRLRQGASSPSAVVHIVYLFPSAEQVSVIGGGTIRTIVESFPTRLVGREIHIDGVDVLGNIIPIIVTIGTVKDDPSIGRDVSLRIIDDLPGSIDGLSPISGRTVVFRSERDVLDARPGTVVVEVSREDLYPMAR